MTDNVTKDIVQPHYDEYASIHLKNIQNFIVSITKKRADAHKIGMNIDI